MQIYGLPQGNVVDVGRAKTAGTRFRQGNQLFEQGQQDRARNIEYEKQDRALNQDQLRMKRLYAGLKSAEQNPGVLQAVARDYPDLAPQLGPLMQAAQADPNAYKQGLGELQAQVQYQMGTVPEKPEKQPDAIRQYEYAKAQGFPGTFEQWKNLSKPAGVNINQYPAPEKGYRYVMDENNRPVSMEPIPGGPADREQQNVDRANEVKRERELNKSDLVSQEIDRALKTMQTGILPDTGWGAYLKDIPGTDAKKLDNLLSTIKANIGFDTLQGLRDASPTGGALGQVSERELSFLQSTVGSLDQSQDDDELAYNLKRLWNAYQDTIHGPGAGPERFNLEPPQQQPEPTQQSQQGDYVQIQNDAQFENLPSGTMFIGPDGTLRQKP